MKTENNLIVITLRQKDAVEKILRNNSDSVAEAFASIAITRRTNPRHRPSHITELSQFNNDSLLKILSGGYKVDAPPNQVAAHIYDDAGSISRRKIDDFLGAYGVTMEDIKSNMVVVSKKDAFFSPPDSPHCHCCESGPSRCQ